MKLDYVQVPIAHMTANERGLIVHALHNYRTLATQKMEHELAHLSEYDIKVAIADDWRRRHGEKLDHIVEVLSPGSLYP
jgi:hypothetical protein